MGKGADTASSPSVSPVPASIPSASFVRFLVHDNDEAVAAWVRPDAVLSITQFWEDSWVGGGGYDYCVLNLGQKIVRVLGTGDDIVSVLASAIEARRAETQSGSVHESAGPKDDAQTPAPPHFGDPS